jgi:hypothetical protein
VSGVVTPPPFPGGSKPTIIGKTNLPDGMELMITIHRKGSSYMAQDKVKVLGGEFKSTTFSQGDAPLNPGTYKLEISSSLAGFQSPSVQTAIGKDGNILKGPLSKKSTFGGRVVEYKTSFKVSGGVASKDKDKAAVEKSNKDQYNWWVENCESQCNLLRGMAKRRKEQFDWDSCYAKCIADEPK